MKEKITCAEKKLLVKILKKTKEHLILKFQGLLTLNFLFRANLNFYFGYCNNEHLRCHFRLINFLCHFYLFGTIFWFCLFSRNYLRLIENLNDRLVKLTLLFSATARLLKWLFHIFLVAGKHLIKWLQNPHHPTTHRG